VYVFSAASFWNWSYPLGPNSGIRSGAEVVVDPDIFFTLTRFLGARERMDVSIYVHRHNPTHMVVPPTCNGDARSDQC
jgi:hypothetical protein